jgi:hypothetical protein
LLHSTTLVVREYGGTEVMVQRGPSRYVGPDPVTELVEKMRHDERAKAAGR